MKIKEKIHITKLMEKANDWFNECIYDDERANIIIKAYMKKHNIKEKDVDY